MPYYCYIMTNKLRTVLYAGVTGDMQTRLAEHVSKFNKDSFTANYNVNRLVWSESFQRVEDAIAMEKRIKGWSRAKKLELTQSRNPRFQVLN